MGVICGYVWQKGGGEWNGDSVFLQQGFWGRKSLVFGGVCSGIGAGGAGVTASGYLSARLLEWFRKKGTDMLGKEGEESVRRELIRETEQIYGELQRYCNKKQVSIEVTLTGMLIAGSSFWMIHQGSSRAYLLNRRYGKSHIRLLTQEEGDGEKIAGEEIIGEKKITDRSDTCKCICGRIQKKVGLLLCTEGFYKGLSPGVMSQCLAVQEIDTQQQIEKRLWELMIESRSKGCINDISAVYLQTS